MSCSKIFQQLFGSCIKNRKSNKECICDEFADSPPRTNDGRYGEKEIDDQMENNVNSGSPVLGTSHLSGFAPFGHEEGDCPPEQTLNPSGFAGETLVNVSLTESDREVQFFGIPCGDHGDSANSKDVPLINLPGESTAVKFNK